MKLLSIVVPCYNSQEYMSVSIDSLLMGDDRIEIIIVNDGSTDDTARIADAYHHRFPEMIRVIHKENGGHGSAIDAGLAVAQGLYFKVLDSDDWLNQSALEKILNYIEHNQTVDLIVANYRYEKKGARHKKIMHYRRSIPQETIVGWDAIHFPLGTYFMMHSMIHRTEILRTTKLALPEHTFYVDNLFVFRSLMHVQTIVYFDEILYHYFIGRDDQSVNEQVMIRRIDQQLRVNHLMIAYYVENSQRDFAVDNYLFHHLEIIMAISSTMLRIENTPESELKRAALWQTVQKSDPQLYSRLTHRLMGWNLSKKDGFSRRLGIVVYRITQKLFGFN
ncbi:glycosyltransferase family 2 protein [Erysipelothrix sp. HDW6C]|uniref:glycosyltransferase family 2 protein n=1 Tax=Erysipelothrix sp. HDW6C TaxID=2714930 RepID=UPI00140AAE59|nr:glycosyltransferase family 2 protein [Erysipelothrix sp. HDW6C]QIK69453.1 glycosyltransferase family 2 protein [Erysipelothrix sp. HDW6C]